MSQKLWSGRFKKTLHPAAERFTQSLSVDRRLAPYDIAGSIAHLKMLSRARIVPNSIAKKIISQLSKMKDINFPASGAEDIHTYIENYLTRKIGPKAGYLHTGRSRNDQVQTDMRLYIKDQIKEIIKLIAGLQKAIVSLAAKNNRVIIPGFTHLQHAQPVLLAHHLLAYVEMLQRDKERFQDLIPRVDILPLGSGALAGSNLPLDRAYLARLLGFSQISRNSIDSVSDRDYLLELLSDISITGMHLSRMAEEFVLWSTAEFNYIELDDSLCTGSSLMPNKKNPDTAELLRAQSGRFAGNFVNLLTVLKGLPLTYNRDLQEDKPPVFDSIDLIKQSLQIAALLFGGTVVNKKRLAQITGQCDWNLATDLAEFLVSRGIPFRKAHYDTGRIILFCADHNLKLGEIPLKILKKYNSKFTPEATKMLNPSASVRNKKTAGSTNPQMVNKELKRWKKILSHA